MLATQGTVQELEQVRAALVLGAIGIVIFWRTVLRLLIAIIAVVIVVAIGTGAMLLLQALHQ